jgi:molybdopterin-guanine dinucleotide biosynthesis protein B
MAASILCFAGRSNSGKTTLIERLIPVLTEAGYRVATVKHAGHGFELDTEGKDSWRHKRAGASAVVVLSKGSMAMFADVAEEMKVEEVREQFLDKDLDLIIAEGWKSEGYPKIAVVREELSEIAIPEKNLIAIVSMKPIQAAVPCLDRDDIQGVADFIIRHYPKRPSV